jgi:peroxiredoxin
VRLALGAEAPPFRLRGVDGEERTLASYRGAALLALVQSCNHCPYVLAWEDRLSELAQAYADRGVRIAAFNSNDASRYPEDSFERMVARSAQKSFGFDYLHDPGQELARALGSQRTPEVFLFDRGRRLVYHGAVDDNRDGSAVSCHYLRDALEAALAGQPPPVAETAAVGCSVKWLP